MVGVTPVFILQADCFRADFEAERKAREEAQAKANYIEDQMKKMQDGVHQVWMITNGNSFDSLTLCMVNIFFEEIWVYIYSSYHSLCIDKSALVEVMAWHWPSDKSLPQTMMPSLSNTYLHHKTHHKTS